MICIDREITVYIHRTLGILGIYYLLICPYTLILYTPPQDGGRLVTPILLIS